MKPHIAVALAMLGSTVLGESYQTPAKILESFEDGIPERLTVTGQSLTLDKLRMKQGQHSLKWEWKGNDRIVFDTPIGYRTQRTLSEQHANLEHADPTAGDIYEPPRGLFMWIYNEEARPQRIRIQFGRGDEVDCWFDYNLNFRGWRTIAVGYAWGDMKGSPREDMTRMTINAPTTGSGTFYFDTLGLSVPMNPRTVGANPQLPEIDQHPRLVPQYPHLLHAYSQYTPSFNLEPLTAQTLADFRSLEAKAIGYWFDKPVKVDMERLRKLYRRFEIVREGDNIYGRPLVNKNTVLEYFSERGLPKDEAMEGLFEWRHAFGGTLISLARAWHSTGVSEEKSELADMFINLVDYGVDQGFDTGAGLGWIHHYSYIIREYAPSMLLMKDLLRETGRLERAIEICKWFYSFGQVYREDVVYGWKGRKAANADELQGILTQRLICALLMEDSPEKARDLQHFSSYFSNITTAYANALDETYKPDGTVFHHAGHAFGYGGRAIFGGVRTWNILKDTQFQASDAARKRLLKVADTYHDCMFGEPEMTPKAFAGIRFSNYKHPTQFDGMREMLGGTAEPLDGFRMLPYSCVGLKRQKNDWMMTVRTHSKYVYPFESWGKQFFAYPLFIANGYLDVTYPDSLDSLSPGGETPIWHDGIDWRRWPGTTTVHLPMEQIATRVGQVRDEGGEYLFSDQPFSGGVASSYGCGIQVFQFKGHDKYGLQSFTGKKSWFFVGDTVVCLGSDIRSDIPEYNVETTLFQNRLVSAEDPIVLNGTDIREFPVDRRLSPHEPQWLIDRRGTGYYVPRAEIRLTRSEQIHPDRNGKDTVSGRFATAWLDHGKAPKGVGYEYVLVADADAERMHALVQHPTTRVLQQDHIAHVVALDPEDATAYAVYAESGATFAEGPVKAVNKQSTFLVKRDGDRLRLSVADPDLNIYDGQDDLLPDGTRCELSIYEREWFYWPSRSTSVHISLDGVWQIHEQVQNMETVDRQAKIQSWDEGTTIVTFECRDGLSAEVVLSKAKEKE